MRFFFYFALYIALHRTQGIEDRREGAGARLGRHLVGCY